MGRDNKPDGGRRILKVGSVIYGADEEIADWVAARIPGYVRFPGEVAIGIEKRGRIVAGVVYDRYNGHHIEASIAAEPGTRWADRRTLKALFAYPFYQLGVKAITILVPHDNLQSLNMVSKMGFKPAAIIRFAAHDGGPLLVLQMTRNECRWLGHGKEQQAA